MALDCISNHTGPAYNNLHGLFIMNFVFIAFLLLCTILLQVQLVTICDRLHFYKHFNMTFKKLYQVFSNCIWTLPGGQTIQIKALVCDSECPYDFILGWASMAQLSAWQDYTSHKLYIQQISIPLMVRNNIHVLPGKTRIVSLTLQPNKTSFTPRHTIISKGMAYIMPLDSSLPLRPIGIEFGNNHCCIEIHNTSDTTVEFLHGQGMAYFDARSKGLVQMNNSKHFPIDQYLNDRMTPATLSPTPLAYEKPIHPTEMKCITTCTELPVDDTNKSTSDDKYPWLDPDDTRRNMTDTEIL